MHQADNGPEFELAAIPRGGSLWHPGFDCFSAYWA